MLSANDLNAEFNNLLNALNSFEGRDLDGHELILDVDGDTSLRADTDDRIDFRLAGTDLFRFDGTVTTPVNGLDWIASATGNAVQIKAVGSDTNIDINMVPKGSGRLQGGGVDIFRDANLFNAQNFI